jgi:RNA polymerase sigma-70 factor, ECF subfamily
MNPTPLDCEPARTEVAATAATADEEVLLRIQREHGRAVFNFLLGLTYGDRHRAEDLMQETVMRAWQHPEALAPERGSLRPWLLTVARRLAIDARRARQIRPEEINDTFVDGAPSPVDEIERWLMGYSVRQAVKKLSRQHRAVLVEIYFRGRSVAEAAEVLGVPAGTVKSRTYYALRALKQALEDEGAAA